MKYRIDELKSKFAAGTLTKEEESELEDCIAHGLIHLEELEEFEDLLIQLDQHLILELPPGAKFRTMQSLETSGRIIPLHRHRLINYLAWAASIILIGVFAFLIGKNTNSSGPQLAAKTANLEEEMVKLINNDHASERLRAVNMGADIDQVDKKVIDVLILTLRNDDHANVRIACVDVLLGMVEYPYVREALISSIPYQDNPLVIMHLAESLSKIGENKALENVEEYLEKSFPPGSDLETNQF